MKFTDFTEKVIESIVNEEAAIKLDFDQVRIKIPANDNTRPTTGEVIDLDSRRAAAKDALSKMSEADRKSANEFIKKNKTLLQRLSSVGARSAARHGVATISSVASGPLAPAVAAVLNVAMLGWDLADAGVEIWDWAKSNNAKDIKQGNANRAYGNDLAMVVPRSPRQNSRDDDAYEIKHLTQQSQFGAAGMRDQAARLLSQRQAEYRRDQQEWDEEFGKTHLDNGTANPDAGYQDKIMRIAQAGRDAQNKASDNELIKKAQQKPQDIPPVVNFTNIPPLIAPTFNPGTINNPNSKDTEIDTTLPKRIQVPNRGDPFKAPKSPVEPAIEPAPKGPKVITKSPTQPKRTDKDLENPIIPGELPPPEFDPNAPELPDLPKRGDPFKAPKSPVEPAPKGPKVVTTPPKQPKRTDKDLENPIVPGELPPPEFDPNAPEFPDLPKRDDPFKAPELPKELPKELPYTPPAITPNPHAGIVIGKKGKTDTKTKNKTKEKPKGKTTSRRVGGDAGSGDRTKSTANQMKFSPINIRDPLNLKRYG